MGMSQALDQHRLTCISVLSPSGRGFGLSMNLS